ncbi:MAG: NHL repeat-containing protein [Planctomycetota bacterium]|nr:NHL repeat-containing protein [Planctomycetota bacterium]
MSHRTNARRSGPVVVFLPGLLACLLLGTGGCAYVGAAVALSLAGSSDGGRETTAQAPPVVLLNPIPVRQFGDVQVDYTLSDANGDPADIQVDFSTDGGLTYGPATEGPGSDGTLGLAAPATGMAHLYVWDSGADIGTAVQTQTRILFTPTGLGGSGTPSESNEFIAGNDSPVISVTSPGPSSQLVAVEYFLLDSTSDTCSILAEYSIDGGVSFLPATIAVGNTSNLDSLDTGIGMMHRLAWNSLMDLGQIVEPAVMFRIEPSDPFQTGTAQQVTFDVTNNDSPLAFLDPVDRQDGNVTITFILVDPDDDLIDVTFEYLPAAGPPWLAMSLTPASVTTMLASNISGVSHSVAWDSPTDIGAGAATVDIRVTPDDGVNLVAPFELLGIVVGNDAPVILSIDQPLIGDTRTEGIITVILQLSDTTSDPVDLEIEFSTDAGLTFSPATINVGLLNGVPSSPAGIEQRLSWDTFAPGNIGINNLAVDLRMRPKDTAIGVDEFGAWVNTGDFNVNNSGVPVAFVASPLPNAIVAGDVTISYLLFQPNGAMLGIEVFYSTDNLSFLTATERTGLPSEGTVNLSSAIDGVNHIFVWDSVADLPGNEGMVWLRIHPMDASGAGIVHTMSAPFLVNNNFEPEAFVDTPPSPQITGTVAIDYALADAEGDTVEVLVEYSTVGGAPMSFQPATVISTDMGVIGGASSEIISGLSSAAAGIGHALEWDAAGDGVAIAAAENLVVVRITPRDDPQDPLGLGNAGRTAEFTVDNTDPPIASALLNTSNAGVITFDYTLADTESNLITVRVEYSTSGGVPGSFLPAMIPSADGPIMGNEIQDLSSSPAGVPHTFDWDSNFDIGRTDITGSNVVIQVTPTDSKIGTSASASLDVLNNDAPEVLVNDVNGLQTGDVTVAYRLRDTFSDTCSIMPQYSLDGGPFVDATPSPTSEPTSGLSSGPPGQEPGHLFTWDSSADISTTRFMSVVIQIRANDGIADGPFQMTSPFGVDNSITADLILGQETFTQGPTDGRGLASSGNGGGSDSFAGGATIHYDGSNLYVADRANGRVLILFDIPTSTFQTADRLLGQPDFSTNVPNYPDFTGASSQGMFDPLGVYSDGTRLYVADSSNHRVLIWNSIPTANFAPADLVLGQPDKTSNAANRGGSPAANSLNTPYRVSGDGTHLYVSDTENHRVLIYNLPITVDGQAAVNVLGQIDMMQSSPNQGGMPAANTLNRPRGVYTDGTNIYVADSENHRVLIWAIPGGWTDGDPATRVLGQALMSDGNPNDPSRDYDTMDFPYDVHNDGTNTLVADRNNNRVLLWTMPITADGQAADFVIGQVDGTSGNYLTTQEGFSEPTGVFSTASKIIILEQGNNRVMIYNSIPTADYAPADVVFGQETFAEGSTNHLKLTASTLPFAMGLDSDGNRLFVSQWDDNRVLGWSSIPDVNNKNADLVFGQVNFTDGARNTTPDGLLKSMDVAYDPAGARLFVADTGNNRIVLYKEPFSVGQTGDAFLGQMDGMSGAAGTSDRELDRPSSIAWDGSKLWVADSGNNRILRFSTFATNDPADRFLGQGDFMTGVANHDGTDLVGDRSLNYPIGIAVTGGAVSDALIVADTENNRVLIWNSLPTGDDDPATLVLGQADFTLGGSPGLGRAGLNRPVGVEAKGTGLSDALYVADGANFRALIWDSIPSAGNHGAPADRLIGQPNFLSAAPNDGGVSNRTLFTFRFWCVGPAEVSPGGTTKQLWFPDTLNNRVLRFDVTP